MKAETISVVEVLLIGEDFSKCFSRKKIRFGRAGEIFVVQLLNVPDQYSTLFRSSYKKFCSLNAGRTLQCLEVSHESFTSCARKLMR